MVKPEPYQALHSYRLRSGLRTYDVEAGPVGRHALNVFNADAEADSDNRADLFTLLIKSHPEDLALSSIVSKKNSVRPGNVCHPGGVELTADERRHAFWHVFFRARCAATRRT